MQSESFTHTTLGSTGIPVCRMGLSATYRPGKKAVYYAFDHGINYFFGFGIDTQMTRAMRDIVKTNRDSVIIATGVYNLIWGYPDIRKTLEKRLRQWGTDYIDLFMFLGVRKKKEFPQIAREELIQLREEGKVRAIGMSTHDRKFAGELAEKGTLDAMMIRYNAAHRGAEEDIFPYTYSHNPGIISFTATRWRYLIRRPKGWSSDAPVPTASDCYRFVLSNPHVHVCMTAPSNMKQLKDNLKALDLGSLSSEEMDFMKNFGDVVHNQRKWFM
ncbi:MAG: aldo/keto reductase [Calditrichaeota bacterium]|nr:aldo/keto reductase [Calditrichota bacterium]RQV92908.1 MAG: aldo/keto reductase [bacterium]RQW02652.1 MAG: aldo/keto reductase [Calditrichota bacterium]